MKKFFAFLFLTAAMSGFASTAHAMPTDSWTYVTSYGARGEFVRERFEDWTERVAGREYYFRVTQETPDYVMLYDASRQVSILLQSNRCFYAGPNTGNQWTFLVWRQ